MLNTADLFDEDFAPVEEKKILSLVPVTDDDDEVDIDLESVGATSAIVIKTPFYDIHFKVGDFAGTEIRPNDSTRFTPMAVLDAIADKEIICVAYRSAQIQIDVYGKEAVVDRVAPKASEAFDMETGRLLPEFARTRNSNEVQKLEQFFAEAAVSTATIRALSAARDEMFPFAKRPLQLAWDTRPDTSVGIYDSVRSPAPGQKSSLEEAVDYRRDTCSLVSNARRILTKQRENPQAQQPVTTKTTRELLGF